MLPHPLFIQTVYVFKNYLFCCFEHFTRHITVYSSKGLEYNCHAVLTESKYILSQLFFLSGIFKKKKKRYHGRGALSGFFPCSLCPSHGRGVWGQQEGTHFLRIRRQGAELVTFLFWWLLDFDFCPGEVAMKPGQVILLSTSLHCSTVHS